MTAKATIRLSVIFFTCVMWSCQSASPQKGARAGQAGAAMPMVEGFVVKPVVTIEKIIVSGTLRPFEETELMPEVSGRVVMLNMPEGAFVKKGMLLAKLFDDDLQAGLKKAAAQLALARETEQRQAQLLKVNAISQSDYDQAALQVKVIQADIDAIQAQIRKTEVRAPFDGEIGLRGISLGAEVTPQTPLAAIRSLRRLKLDFDIPEKHGNQVKPGMKVLFTMENDTNRYEATVSATEGGIETGTRNLKIRAVADNRDSLLEPGEFANVSLELSRHENALMVPTQAIIPLDQEKELIVARNGRAKFVIIKAGIRQASEIEVLEGIAPGDTIVTTGLLFLKPGAGLKFSKVSM